MQWGRSMHTAPWLWHCIISFPRCYSWGKVDRRRMGISLLFLTRGWESPKKNKGNKHRVKSRSMCTVLEQSQLGNPGSRAVPSAVLPLEVATLSQEGHAPNATDTGGGSGEPREQWEKKWRKSYAAVGAHTGWQKETKRHPRGDGDKTKVGGKLHAVG